jgi:hypothetical protein
MFCKKIKQWPLAPNLWDLLITHANLARRVTFFSKMAFGKCRRVWRVWKMTIFGECEFGEYSIKTLAPSQCTFQAWYIWAILAKLAKLAKYHDKYFGKCEFGKYSKKSLASLASLASHKKFQNCHFGKCEYSPKMDIFCRVLELAKFACEWPFLKKNNRKCKKVISNKDITASQALVQRKSNIFWKQLFSEDKSFLLTWEMLFTYYFAKILLVFVTSDIFVCSI